MSNEQIITVTEAYIRGEKAAEYVIMTNAALADLETIFKIRKGWRTESERQDFFDGFWTAFRR